MGNQWADMRFSSAGRPKRLRQKTAELLPSTETVVFMCGVGFFECSENLQNLNISQWPMPVWGNKLKRSKPFTAQYLSEFDIDLFFNRISLFSLLRRLPPEMENVLYKTFQ